MGDFQGGRAAEAAQLLVSARNEGALASDFPTNLRPSNIDDAYAIQDATLARLGAIGGWKVSIEKRVGGPIPASRIFDGPRDLASLGLRLPAVELEIAYRFGRDLPSGRTEYSDDDVLGAIGSVHVALEICKSRFADPKAVSPLSVIADLQNCEAIVVGPGEPAWRSVDLGQLVPVLSMDGARLDLPARPPKAQSNVPGALTWLANHAAGRGHRFRKGDVIITGSLLKVTDIRPGARVEGRAGGLAAAVAKF